MCYCTPNIRTPNCGSVACVAAGEGRTETARSKGVPIMPASGRLAVQFLLTRIGSWTHARWDQHLRHEVGDAAAGVAIKWIEETFDVKGYGEQLVSEQEQRGEPTPPAAVSGAERPCKCRYLEVGSEFTTRIEKFSAECEVHGPAAALHPSPPQPAASEGRCSTCGGSGLGPVTTHGFGEMAYAAAGTCSRCAGSGRATCKEKSAASDEERARECLDVHAYGGWLEERVEKLVPLLVAALAAVRAEATEVERERCAKIAVAHGEWARDPGRFEDAERLLVLGAAEVIAAEIRQRPAGEK